MKLLAFDTSADACSAALYLDGALEQRLELAPRRHGELILPMLRDLLAAAGIGLKDLDAIAFGRGPGSFTGVRLAVAVAQGLAFGVDRPTVPVSTLGAMAGGEFRRTGRRWVLAALDARMGEVYWGAYQVVGAGLVEPLGEERVLPPEAVPVPGPLPGGGEWTGVGSGWGTYDEALGQRIGAGLGARCPQAICEAQDIARLAVGEVAAGRLVPAERAQPVYLRDRVTHPAAAKGPLGS